MFILYAINFKHRILKFRKNLGISVISYKQPFIMFYKFFMSLQVTQVPKLFISNEIEQFEIEMDNHVR